MIAKFFCKCFCVLVLLDFRLIAYDYKADLVSKICQQDKRYRTFKRAIELMIERNHKVIVETGTSRKGKTNCSGDGCSTIVFADFARQYGLKVYSVDIDIEAVKEAKNAISDCSDFVEITASDSVEYLKNFYYPIDFLYLDSYDYDERNPKPSQEHHLKEIIVAYSKLHDGSAVLIDDCGLPGGGKGKLVIEFLQNKGWKIHTKGYQVLMTKNS